MSLMHYAIDCVEINIYGLMQKRHNSTANALELCL